jgi:hypothetical protein
MMGLDEAAEVLEALAASARRGEASSSLFGSGSSTGGKLVSSPSKEGGGREETYVAVVGRIGRWVSGSK